MLLWFLTLPIRAAFYYRWRGMAHNWNTTVNRLMYGCFIGLEYTVIAHAWHLPLWIGIISAVMTFAGACIGHSQWQDGEHPAEMGLMTTIRLAGILVPFVYFYPLACLLIPLGMLSGVAYFLGYKMKIGFYGFEIQWCVPGDASWAEFFTGALAFGLPLMILGLYALA